MDDGDLGSKWEPAESTPPTRKRDEPGDGETSSKPD